VLGRELHACKNYLFFLKVDKLPSRIDLRLIFHNVSTLTAVRLTYGARHLGIDYERGVFGMQMADAASLVECIRLSQCIVSLSLPCNLLDDDLLKMLLSGLVANKTLRELDLSHNRVGDQGARRLAKYLLRTDVLAKLDLGDNMIRYEGSRCIGQALRTNFSLKVLSLKHNRLDDASGAKLFNDLQQNRGLTDLNLSANQLASRTVSKAAEYLTSECCIERLDLSCNKFLDNEAEDVVRDDMLRNLEGLRSALSSNSTLQVIDLRSCGLPKNMERELTETVIKRELDRRRIPLYRTATPVGEVPYKSSTLLASAIKGPR
jgi:Ran GTPase-activating protein (RanGAP) involved in mRNA processing and transport